MLRFCEWVIAVGTVPFFEARGLGGSRSDIGRQAFIDSQNWSFKDFLKKLLAAKKITDPLLVQEAQALVAPDSSFSYGRELLRIATMGRARLAGGDAIHAATEAAGKLWEKVWRPESYAAARSDSR